MDSGNRAEGYSTHETHDLHHHDVHHQPEVLHRKGRDSGYSVDGHHDPKHSPDSGSGLRKVINKLNPLHRSPSPPTKGHSTAVATGVGHATDGHRTMDRQPGLSATNPNIPGHDNRTLGEKAHDALDPRRHPDQHSHSHQTGGLTTSNRQPGVSASNPNVPGQDNRTLGEKAHDALDPRRHPDQHPHQQQLHAAEKLDGGAHHQPSHSLGGGRSHNTKEAALGMAAAAGLGTTTVRHHEQKKHEQDLREHQRGTADYASTSTHDNRSTLEKLKDKVDPRVKADRREAQVVPGTAGHHVSNHGVGDVEHSLRETRLDNDNPAHLRDDRSMPYAADSTDTLGRPQVGRVPSGLAQYHQQTSSHVPETSRLGEETRSPATGGLHIRSSDEQHLAHNRPGVERENYQPDVAGENYQPGYSIPPTQRKGEGLPGSDRRESEIPPVHATGFRAEGGNFDASRPGAGAEGRRLMEQVEHTGSSLDSSMR